MGACVLAYLFKQEQKCVMESPSVVCLDCFGCADCVLSLEMIEYLDCLDEYSQYSDIGYDLADEI